MINYSNQLTPHTDTYHTWEFLTTLITKHSVTNVIVLLSIQFLLHGHKTVLAELLFIVSMLNYEFTFFLLVGERHFTHITEQVQFFVAVTPCLETIETQLRSLLLSGATHHHVVYAGHYIEGSGAWILQDSLFTADQFQQIFKEPDFANSLQRISSVQQDLSISLYGCVGNAWAVVTKSPHLKTCGLAVNLLAETEDSPGDATQFMDFVDPLYNARTSKELLPSSEVVGKK